MKTLSFLLLALVLTVGGTAHAQKKPKKTDAGKAGATQVKTVVDSAAMVQQYAGTYHVKGSPDFTQAIVTVQDGKLYGRADTQADNLPMTSTPTPDVFVITLPDTVLDITFLRDEAKQVAGIKIYMYGTELRGEKAK